MPNPKRGNNYPESFRIRLDPELKTAAIEYGRQHGIKSLSEIIRRACHHYLASNVIPEARQFREDLNAFRQEFARVGSNLNQVALAFNSNGVLLSGELTKTHEEIRGEFKKLARLLERIHYGMGNP